MAERCAGNREVLATIDEYDAAGYVFGRLFGFAEGRGNIVVAEEGARQDRYAADRERRNGVKYGLPRRSSSR